MTINTHRSDISNELEVNMSGRRKTLKRINPSIIINLMQQGISDIYMDVIKVLQLNRSDQKKLLKFNEEVEQRKDPWFVEVVKLE